MLIPVCAGLPASLSVGLARVGPRERGPPIPYKDAAHRIVSIYPRILMLWVGADQGVSFNVGTLLVHPALTPLSAHC